MNETRAELPKIVSSAEWRAARAKLLGKEGELTRARAALAAERRRLPMVRVDKSYAFDGPDGTASLIDLFHGRGQLLAYHFWFEPGEEPCEGCSLWVSSIGDLANLYARDTSLVLVSRAPPAEVEAFKERMGWTVPWFSVLGGDFNTDAGYAGEAQISVFVRHDEAIFRTYITSGRSLEAIGNHWSLLDLTPRGA